MTILKCSATKCLYNENELCSRGDIEITGDNAHRADETNCGSFRDRATAGMTNSKAHHCAQRQRHRPGQGDTGGHQRGNGPEDYGLSLALRQGGHCFVEYGEKGGFSDENTERREHRRYRSGRQAPRHWPGQAPYHGYGYHQGCGYLCKKSSTAW